MKCPKCGGENPENVKFCGKCGAKVVASPPPAAPAQTVAAPKSVRCGRCGSENPANLRFCNNCGAPTGQAAVQPPALVQSAPQIPPPRPMQMPMQQPMYPAQPTVSATSDILPMLMRMETAVLALGLFVIYYGLVGASYWADYGYDTRSKVEVILAILIGLGAITISVRSLLGKGARR